MADRPTAGSASFHCTPEEGRRTLSIQQWGTLCQCSWYPLCSQGEEKTKGNLTTRQEVLRSSPRWAGSLRQRGHTRIHLMGCSRLYSVKGDSARGTEHYECQGHWIFKSAMGTLDTRGNQSQCLDQVRWIFLYIFAMAPTPDQSWGFPIYS